jgi:hypothetical protein
MRHKKQRKRKVHDGSYGTIDEEASRVGLEKRRQAIGVGIKTRVQARVNERARKTAEEAGEIIRPTVVRRERSEVDSERDIGQE